MSSNRLYLEEHGLGILDPAGLVVKPPVCLSPSSKTDAKACRCQGLPLETYLRSFRPWTWTAGPAQLLVDHQLEQWQGACLPEPAKGQMLWLGEHWDMGKGQLKSRHISFHSREA